MLTVYTRHPNTFRPTCVRSSINANVNTANILLFRQTQLYRSTQYLAGINDFHWIIFKFDSTCGRHFNFSFSISFCYSHTLVMNQFCRFSIVLCGFFFLHNFWYALDDISIGNKLINHTVSYDSSHRTESSPDFNNLRTQIDYTWFLICIDFRLWETIFVQRNQF